MKIFYMVSVVLWLAVTLLALSGCNVEVKIETSGTGKEASSQMSAAELREMAQSGAAKVSEFIASSDIPKIPSELGNQITAQIGGGWEYLNGKLKRRASLSPRSLCCAA